MIRGSGLHSGVTSAVHLHRSAGPVRFLRAGQVIPADIGAVVDTDHRTVLGAGGARVAMVEHLLAALHAADFWSGVVIEVSADELPILDGSSHPWLAALQELAPPDSNPEALRIERSLRVDWGAGRIEMKPGDRQLCTTIDFDHPAIGKQCWSGSPDRFGEVLAARTFGFMKDRKRLQEAGFATAAGPENAIVYNDEGPMWPLRYDDEPVRHKALDALGDLFLMGRPVHASITIVRGSHTLHTSFVRTLRAVAGIDGGFR